MKRKLIREQINKRKNKKGGLITEKKKSEGITKKKQWNVWRKMYRASVSECMYQRINEYIYMKGWN